ncbi:MAG: hypothetical protein WC533_02935 [Candidatus Pacearchaeota archaeon]
MASYLWRKLSDKEREEIKHQAKKIMDDFALTLEKLPDIPEALVEREKDVRDESEDEVCSDSDFRDTMLKNAPKVKDDCVLAEKGAWVE